MQTPLQQLLNIPIDLIDPNPHQPRQVFDEEALSELADSIREYGVLQPILVKKKADGRFELIAGERRLRASKLVGLKMMPAQVRNVEGTDMAVMALIENLQRSDLDFFEEAQGYRKLITDHGMTQQQVADKMGKSQSAIANKLRLLYLSEGTQAAIHEAGLSERHARALLKLPDEKDQLKIIDWARRTEATVKDTEKYVELTLLSKMQRAEDEGPSIRGRARDLRLIMNELNKIVDSANSLGLKVQLHKENKGRYVEVKLKIGI